MRLPSAWARAVAIASHVVLLVGLAAAAGRLGVMLALPLLALLPGLWRGKPYVYAVASLVLVFYAGGGVMEAFAQAPRRGPALAFALVAVVEFSALVMYVRLRGVEARRAAPAPRA